MRNKKLKNITQRATAMLLAALTMLPAGLLSPPAKAAEPSTTMTKFVVWDWIDDVQALGTNLDYHPDNEKKNISYDDTKYSRMLFYYTSGGERYYFNVHPWNGAGFDDYSTFKPDEVYADEFSRIGHSAHKEWNQDLIDAEKRALDAGYSPTDNALLKALIGDYDYGKQEEDNKVNKKSFVSMGGLRTPYVQYSGENHGDHTWRLWASDVNDNWIKFAVCLTDDYEKLDVRNTYGGYSNTKTWDADKEKDQETEGWHIDNHFVYANSANHRGTFSTARARNICFWHWDEDTGAPNEGLMFSPSGRTFWAHEVPTILDNIDRFYVFCGKEYQIGQLGADFTVQEDQNQTLGSPLYYIPEGKTLTVARDGVLTIDGTLLNDGKIVVEDGGLLVVKDGATIMPFTKYNSKCGAITSYGTVIVENNALLCGGGVDGLKILGGVVVNFGVVAGESMTVSRNYAIDNRATGWVIAGRSPTGQWRTEFVKNAIAEVEPDFSNPESYFAKVSTNFDSFYSIPDKGVYGNTDNVRLYGEKAVGTPSDPLLSVYTKATASEQYTPLFTDEPVDSVSMTVKGNTATYMVGNKKYEITNKLVSAAIGRGEGKRETIFKDKWVGDLNGAYVTISPSHAPNMSLDLAGGGKSSGTKVQISTAANSTSNLWHIVNRGTYVDYYSIDSCHAPGMALDNDGVVKNGTQAIIRDTSDGYRVGSTWYFKFVDSKYFRIVTRGSFNDDDNLGCQAGATADGTPVVMRKMDGADSPPNDQLWFFSNLLSESVFTDAVDCGTATEFVPESADDLRLAVDGSSIKSAKTGSYSQRWRLEVAGTDNLNGVQKPFYTIVETTTGKALAISGTGFSNGAALITAPATGSEMHHWYLDNVTGEFYQIVARGNTEYVITAGGSNGAATIRTNTNAKEQRWKVNGVMAEVETVNTSDPLHNQTFTIAPKHAPGMNLGVKDNGINNGATAELQTASATSTAQQWTFKHLGEADLDGTSRSYYSIENVRSGKSLDNADGASGTQSRIWDLEADNNNQHWFAVPNDDGSYSLIPKVNPAVRLDVKGNSKSAGAAIQVYTATGNDNQKWTLTAAQEEDNFDGKTFTLAPSHAQDMRLDLASYSKDNGTKMVIKKAQNHESQCWTFVKQGTAYVNGKRQSYYTIESCYAEGSALDAGGYSNGTQPHIWEKGSSLNANQLWFVLPTDDGYYNIVPRSATTNCIIVDSALTRENARVLLWDIGWKNASQKWKLTETFKPVSLGTFEVQSVAAPEFSVAASSGDNRADVHLWATHEGGFIRWKFVKMGHDDHGDYYKIASQANDRVIDVSGIAGNNSQAIMLDFGGDPEQFWYLDFQGSDALGDYYAITLRSNDKLRLGVRGSAYQNGAKVVTTTEKGRNTHFRLGEDIQPVSLGTFEFGGSANQGMRMDVQDRSNNNGGNIQIYHRNGDQNGGDNPYQKWRIVRRGYTLRNGAKTAYYSIENVASGKVLDLSGTGAAAAINLANVTQYDYESYTDQHWFIEVQTDNTVKFCNRANPELYLDTPGGGDSSSVRVAKTGNEYYRRWVLHPVAERKDGGTFYIPGNPAAVEVGIPGTFIQDYVLPIHANAKYNIVPMHNMSLRIDLPDGYTGGNNIVHLWTAADNVNQTWWVEPMGIDFYDGDGTGHVYYKICYGGLGTKALQCEGSGPVSAGLNYYIQDYEGTYDDLWYLEPVGSTDTGTIFNFVGRGTLKNGGVCVEAPGGKGLDAHLKTGALGKNLKYQQWTLIAAS